MRGGLPASEHARQPKLLNLDLLIPPQKIVYCVEDLQSIAN